MQEFLSSFQILLIFCLTFLQVLFVRFDRAIRLRVLKHGCFSDLGILSCYCYLNVIITSYIILNIISFIISPQNKPTGIIKQTIKENQIRQLIDTNTMSNLSNRYKQSIQDQSLNNKFLQLLNSNKPIQSLKDRQILPTIPLSAFHNPYNNQGGGIPLPNIGREKEVQGPKTMNIKKNSSNTKITTRYEPNNMINQLNNQNQSYIKVRSVSQTKFRNINNINNGMAGITTLTSNKINTNNIINNKLVKNVQHLPSSDKLILSSTKNLKNNFRNKSVSSAKKPRSERMQSQKEQGRYSQATATIKKDKQQQANITNNTPQFHVSTSQKVLQQKQYQQITPNKFKIDLPSHTSSTNAMYTTNQNHTNNQDISMNKFTANKTLAQIPNQLQHIMLNIKFGKIQQNLSYKQYLKKQTKPTPQQIISKLEQWLTKYKIKSGLVHTKNLHVVFGAKVISNNSILMQFANYQQLKKELNEVMPGLKYYGPAGNCERSGLNLAASKIQSLFRMKLQMAYYKKLRSLMNKVKIIQRQWRVSLAYKHSQKLRTQAVLRRLQHCRSLNQSLIKNWQLIKTSPRMQIHICSIALEQFKRLSMEDIREREIAQLTRICRCVEPDVTVLYISPVNLDNGVLRYYERVFQFGGKASCFRDRLFVISLDDIIYRIPANLTTVSALLYDAQSLRKIKNLLKPYTQSPTPYAYIIPSYPSQYYTSLASQLQIPILSGPQSLCKLYSTKSGHYELFNTISKNLGEKSPFLLPKTVHGIYSEKELLNTLAVLVYKNRDINRWMLKIDDQVHGRGGAFLNVDGLMFLKELRKTEQDSLEGLQDKQIIGLIVDELQMKLKLRLKIIHKQVYPDYDTYLSHFLTRGGFIQACIQQQSAYSHIASEAPLTQKKGLQRPQQHSISFRIDPNGEFQILTTYSKIQLGFRLVSSSIECPSIMEPDQVDNQKIVRALYRHLWIKGKMFGYFTIDLLCVESGRNLKEGDKQNGHYKCYVIGFDSFLNQKTSSTFMAALTSMSTYNKQKNKYLKNQPSKLQQSKIGQKQLMIKTPRSLSQSSISSTHPTQESQPLKTAQKQIEYIYCPFLRLPNLPTIAEFFKLCKYSNISFDVENKIGSLFLLLGGLQTGCFGFLCNGLGAHAVREQALRLVQFLAREFRLNRNEKVGGHRIANKKKKKQANIGDSNGKNSFDQIGQLRGYLLNSLRRNKNSKNNFKKQDLNLEFIF